MKYIYENVHDLCMGHSPQPLRLRSHLELGRRYLIPCLVIKFPPHCDRHLTAQLLESHIEILDSLPNSLLHELILQVCIDDDIFDDPAGLQELIFPVFKKIESWRTKRRLKMSMMVQLSNTINIMSGGKDLTGTTLAKIKEIAGAGIDLVCLRFNHPIPGYLEALEKQHFLEPLSLFYEYYQKVQLIFFALISEYEHPSCPISIRAPEWMIPNMSQSMEKIYTPLAIITGAKLMSIPSLAQIQNCLFCTFGSGPLAKALTGAPLIMPSIIEREGLGPLGLAFADGLSITTILPDKNDLSYGVKAVKQILDYLNTLHEKDGYSGNRQTRNVLMKSIKDESPLHLLLKHPQICDLAKQIHFAPTGFAGMIKVFHYVVQILDRAHNEGSIVFNDEELDLLHKCTSEIEAEF